MQVIKEKLVKSGLFLLILILSIWAISVIFYGIKQFQVGSQLASINQVANLSHLLVRQQTSLFSILLLNNANQGKLTENLDNLTKEDFVLDASIYSTNGTLLAQSGNSLSLRSQLGLDNGEITNNQQIVEPVYSSNGLEGFLRVTFDASYGQTTKSKINQLFRKLYGELIVVFLLGVLVASSVHYFLSHYRRTKRLFVETAKVVMDPKPKLAINFHRRRRRIK